MATNSTNPDRHAPVAPGPGSILWQYLGDRRLLLFAARGVLLQLAHPRVDAAIAPDHPWVREPWIRSDRALPDIIGVVYDERGADVAARIRRLHRPIGMVGEDGGQHRALDAEAFYWSHAVFFDAVVRMVELFDRPLTAAEKEQAFEESRQWYQLYQVNDRPMPNHWAGYQAYFERVCTTVLTNTAAVTATRQIITDPVRAAHPWLPNRLWRWIARPATTVLWLVARGTVSPQTRARLKLTWTDQDGNRLRLLARVVRFAWWWLPRRVRYLPRARAAFRRTGWWPPRRRSQRRPRNDPAQYEDLADQWWRPRGAFAGLHWLAVARARLVPPARRPGAILVDLGCGAGLLAPHIDTRGYLHLGVDLSASALQQAARHGVFPVRGSVSHIPLADGCADVVVAGEILEHVVDLASVVGEACRILRPGGTLVIDTLAATALTRFLAVTMAERVPGGIPRGMHDPDLFVDRTALATECARHGVSLTLQGIRPSVIDLVRWLAGRDLPVRMLPTSVTGFIFQAWGVKQLPDTLDARETIR